MYFLYHWQDCYRTVYMTNTASVLLKAGTAYPSWAPEFTPGFLMGSMLLIVLVLCVVLLCVVTFWVPYCDFRYDFSMKMMFDTTLLPVVYTMTHVLFTWFVFVYAKWCPTHIVLCCFLFGVFFPDAHLKSWTLLKINIAVHWRSN